LFEEPGYCACIEYEQAGSIHLLQGSIIKLSKEVQVVADVDVVAVVVVVVEGIPLIIVQHLHFHYSHWFIVASY
jgi:hypothetical protein